MTSTFRIERDFLGEKQIPAHAYWGVHTARAVENFPISGTPISAMPQLIVAFGHVKKAAARTKGTLVDAIAQALASVTTRDARGWFAHSGYEPWDRSL